MSVIKPGCIVFDIGAHRGESALNFINAGAGQVVSVEACRDNYVALVDCVKPFKVTPVHAAAWSVPCITSISMARCGTGLSTLNSEKWSHIYPEANYDQPQEVVAITLDMMIGRYGLPYFVKVDVEGAEKEVISGLSQKVQFMTFEFHGKFLSDTLACLSILKELGFSKAIHSLYDVDVNIMPEMEIESFSKWFEELNPGWGNITVS